MKATLLLLLPAALLVSCADKSDPVAPPVSSTGEEYGIPNANAPYQPVQPINPPAAPAPAAVPPPAPVPGTPAPAPTPTGSAYTIKPGDSLWCCSWYL